MIFQYNTQKNSLKQCYYRNEVNAYMYDLNLLVFDINPTMEDDSQVEKLNNLMTIFGGKAEIKRSEFLSHLIVSYDEEKLKKWKSRNAGRIANFYDLSVSEVRDMIKQLGAEPAAKKLGMTKQGMYKRLKRCDESGSKRF